MKNGVCGRFAVVLVDVGDGLVADGVGVEEAAVGLGLVLDVVVAARQRIGIVEAAGADDGAEELVEAALQGPGIGRLRQAARHVPLAAHVGLVAVGLERLGNGDAALVQVAGIALRTGIVGQDADTGLMRVQTGQHRCARGTAARRIVELREAQAVARQPVEVGRFDLAAVAAEVGIAHVVVEDENNVRLAHFGSIRCCRHATSEPGAAVRVEQMRRFRRETQENAVTAPPDLLRVAFQLQQPCHRR